MVLVGLTALLARLVLAPEADAVQPVAPVVDISWEAPPECGSRAEFVEHIEALLGRPLGQVGDPDLDIVARVVAETSGLRLILEFQQPITRVRELRASSCAELRDAAAVVLAMTIDPLVPLAEAPTRPAAEPTSTQPEPEHAPDSKPEPDSELEPEPKPDPLEANVPQPERKHRAPAAALRIAGGVQYPALPTVAGGPSLALGLWWKALRVELVGAWWLNGPTHFDAAPEVGATLSLGWVAPRVCGVPAIGRVAFPLCVGIELGGMRAAAFGTADARTRTLAWVAPQLGTATRVGLSRTLALWIGVEGAVPVVRPSFAIAGLGELHHAPPFVFQALLGLEVRLDGGRATDTRARGQGVGA